MTERPAEIDEGLAAALVADQFPQWSPLPVRPVSRSGWDNRSFRLGEDLLVRLPSAASYAAQVHREHRWLPHLRPHLPLSIPEPVALGRPGFDYPWHWSIYRWIEGRSVAEQPPRDLMEFATDLALFLVSLRAVPAAEGPTPGSENFYRGGSLAVYDEQFREAVTILDGQIDASAALRLWTVALASRWSGSPVWVHGDVAPGNLLLRDGRLCAVIDFGQVCVGDPACDAAIAWTFFRAPYREVFRNQLGLDAATWERARAWALWKAVIVTANLIETNAIEAATSRQTLAEILGACEGANGPRPSGSARSSD